MGAGNRTMQSMDIIIILESCIVKKRLLEYGGE
jgi:hypothetical protein